MGSSAWKVFKKYSAVRWYLVTCVCKDMGDWLVRLSNLIVVQEWGGSGSAISWLVLSALLPKAFVSPIGGFIADRFDRRHSMILLDFLAGIIVLGYFFAVRYESVEIIYIVTGLRSAVSAIYYPVTQAILPIILEDNSQDLQYAGSMATSVYGAMSVVGGLMAGRAAMLFGFGACYVIDSFTYFVSSAVLLAFVHGNFKRRYIGDTRNATDQRSVSSGILTAPTENKIRRCARCNTCCKVCCNKFLDILTCGTRETFHQLAISGCAVLVFMKATDSLIWGPGDVVGVEIATVRFPDGSEDEDATSYRMGLYYCFTGLGVLMGPAFANHISDAERPVTLQRTCIVALFVAMTGWIFAAYSPTYTWYLFSQWWSGIGYGTLWTYSSLMLQILIDPGILGRALSIEYCVYVLAEAASSSVTGPLYDDKFSTRDLCLFGAGLSLACLIFWTIYHLCGGGAAHPSLNQLKEPNKLPGLTKSDDLLEEADGTVASRDDEIKGSMFSSVPESIEFTPPDDDKSVSRRKGSSVKSVDSGKEGTRVKSTIQKPPTPGLDTEENV